MQTVLMKNWIDKQMSFLKDDFILVMDFIFEGRPLSYDNLCQIRDAGVKTVTYFTDWSQIEKARGVYDWSILDRAVNDATKAGLKILIGDYSQGAAWCPKEWYCATLNNTPIENQQIQHWKSLSIWNKEAQQYVEDFIRLLGSRYISDTVKLYSTQSVAGENYLPFEPDNPFYDVAAIEDYRKFVNNDTALPIPYPHRSPNGDAITDEWLRISIVKAMVRRNKLLIELNGINEIWHAGHHLCNWQYAGCGSPFIRDVLDAYLVEFPGVIINGIQYTYWYHEAFDYKNMLTNDIKRYNMKVWAGAEYCTGLQSYTPQLLNSNIYGFILGILSPLSDFTKVEPWMITNIRNSYNAIKQARSDNDS